ncbi:hypothetical protein TSUD_02470 [Trifolium subterraneum]|uniref:Uncharacterized protein n=1 Tax=Trifolium subterraneum TaxID=3900 RepID=A0A2Z6MT56_TRISU|nr:hypothetical protein TSUD_02470 [Trifolium subterraneum]
MGTRSIKYICEVSIKWSVMFLAFCAMCGIVGGIVGDLLGSRGGFILGHILLEIGVILSALTMGIVGTKKSIQMMQNHEFKGFCTI